MMGHIFSSLTVSLPGKGVHVTHSPRAFPSPLSPFVLLIRHRHPSPHGRFIILPCPVTFRVLHVRPWDYSSRSPVALLCRVYNPTDRFSGLFGNCACHSLSCFPVINAHFAWYPLSPGPVVMSVLSDVTHFRLSFPCIGHVTRVPLFLYQSFFPWFPILFPLVSLSIVLFFPV